MQLRTLALGMAAYNRWMNDKIYAAAATLSDEERKRDLGAFFGSIHATLNHILLGDQSWLQRFRGDPVTMKSPRDQLYEDFAALRAARLAMDDDIDRFAAGLDDAFAESTLRFYSVSYQRERAVPAWAAVMHVFNHQTHHRGQVTTLLKQLGRDPGVTDLPWMPLFD